jgi:hypothetical protein
MADPIKCPVCGELNPADGEFCQNCQSRLQLLTGPLRGENAPLQPGQLPTKKVTSELEPILPQWLRDARQQARKSAEEDAIKAENDPKTQPVFQEPDLLAGLSSQTQDNDEDTPDWLTNITGGPATKKKPDLDDTQVKWVELGHDESSGGPGASTADASSLPPWMAAQETAPEKDELTDWFTQAATASSAADRRGAVVQPPTTTGTPTSTPDQPPIRPADPKQASASSEEHPDWLKKFDSGTFAFEQTPEEDANPPPAPATTPTSQNKDGLPDWMNVAATSGAAAPTAQGEPALNESPAPAAVPDWLASLKRQDPQTSGQASALASPVFKEVKPAAPLASPSSPAFTGGSLSSGDVDAIFGSMQIPDWLSSSGAPGLAPAAESSTISAQNEPSIAPAQLPSWVQAMRPVEAAMSSKSSAQPSDTTLETLGPLAGLQGVLPTIPGITGPSTKPMPQSIKLSVTAEQQSHAALLDKVLAAETAPIPINSGLILTSQRTLRWMLAILVLLVVGGAVFVKTQFFAMPARIPNDETEAAISKLDAVTAGAPIMLVFDYEPSLSGEMQTVAAPLLNRLLLLKHPRLVIVSTSPTGAALAESFMAGPMAARQYQRGAQYIDLGYLPGGLAGVYAFAQNPGGVIPFTVDGSPVAQAVPMQGVDHLSDFASLIVLTDSLEAGRVWVEQTGPFRGRASLIVVSSAQAGPMLMPYVNSGQVNGMVSGLNGAAKVEQANGQPGLVRSYWDAYSLGLWLAVLAIVLGGAWNFIRGLQDRRAGGKR